MPGLVPTMLVTAMTWLVKVYAPPGVGGLVSFSGTTWIPKQVLVYYREGASVDTEEIVHNILYVNAEHVINRSKKKNYMMTLLD